MWQRSIIWLAVFISPFFLTDSSQARQGARKALILLTAQEAEQLQLSEEEWQSSTRTRSVSIGPRIVMQHPEVRETETGPVLETVTPTAFSVHFEGNHASVDMASLQIRAKKGIFTKSLTSLLGPHVRGADLQIEGVEIPEGKFRIEIEIADVAGAKTVETYGLEVRKP